MQHRQDYTMTIDDSRTVCIAADNLAAAADTLKQREQEHGSPDDNFGLVADLWSAVFNVPFDAKKVALALLLFKVARHVTNTENADTQKDLIGYAALLSGLGNSKG